MSLGDQAYIQRKSTPFLSSLKTESGKLKTNRFVSARRNSKNNNNNNNINNANKIRIERDFSKQKLFKEDPEEQTFFSGFSLMERRTRRIRRDQPLLVLEEKFDSPTNIHIAVRPPNSVIQIPRFFGNKNNDNSDQNRQETPNFQNLDPSERPVQIHKFTRFGHHPMDGHGALSPGGPLGGTSHFNPPRINENVVATSVFVVMILVFIGILLIACCKVLIGCTTRNFFPGSRRNNNNGNNNNNNNSNNRNNGTATVIFGAHLSGDNQNNNNRNRRNRRNNDRNSSSGVTNTAAELPPGYDELSIYSLPPAYDESIKHKQREKEKEKEQAEQELENPNQTLELENKQKGEETSDKIKNISTKFCGEDSVTNIDDEPVEMIIVSNEDYRESLTDAIEGPVNNNNDDSQTARENQAYQGLEDE